MDLLAAWQERAEDAGDPLSSTLVLATVDHSGQPTTRCLALAGCDERGLVMFMNMGTRKGRDIAGNPKVAATLYWPSLFRQVNVTGVVQPVEPVESDRLWESRGTVGQVASLASNQGQPLHDYAALLARVQATDASEPILRPAEHVGLLLVPQTVEFWHGQPNRLHFRLHYQRRRQDWDTTLLQP
nr:pyridoxal 5'-phosphate synthase [Planosporangium thailandense]